MQENRPRQRFEPISFHLGKGFFYLGKKQLLSAHSSPLIRATRALPAIFFSAFYHASQRPDTIHRQYNE